MNRHTFDPGPLADVRTESAADEWTLVFVRDFRHPPEKVWEVLTDPAQVKEWAPYSVDRDLGGTGPVRLTMIDGDTAEEVPATVRRVERPTVLEYTLGSDVLRWELAPTERGTRLTLRHTLKDREFVPKAAAGWHLCLRVAECLLDGEPVGPIRGQEAMQFGWQELHDRYAERLDVRGR